MSTGRVPCYALILGDESKRPVDNMVKKYESPNRPAWVHFGGRVRISGFPPTGDWRLQWYGSVPQSVAFFPPNSFFLCVVVGVIILQSVFSTLPSKRCFEAAAKITARWYEVNGYKHWEWKHFPPLVCRFPSILCHAIYSHRDELRTSSKKNKWTDFQCTIITDKCSGILRSVSSHFVSQICEPQPRSLNEPSWTNPLTDVPIPSALRICQFYPSFNHCTPRRTLWSGGECGTFVFVLTLSWKHRNVRAVCSASSLEAIWDAVIWEHLWKRSSQASCTHTQQCRSVCVYCLHVFTICKGL